MLSDPLDPLKAPLGKFLELYRILPSEAKARLEIELGGFLKDKSVETQRLYFALLLAAKDGEDIQATIARLHQATSHPVAE